MCIGIGIGVMVFYLYELVRIDSILPNIQAKGGEKLYKVSLRNSLRHIPYVGAFPENVRFV